MFTSYEAAWQNAANLNWRIGTLIVEITLPESLEIEIDGPDERGHCSLYGVDADDLMPLVTRVTWGPRNKPSSVN